MFLVYIADLKALGSLNTSIKFAGEYTFTVPAVSDVSVELEMINIKKWSDDKLCLNLDKTKEIIFHGPHPSKLCVTPPTLCDVERVSSAKLYAYILPTKRVCLNIFNILFLCVIRDSICYVS